MFSEILNTPAAEHCKRIGIFPHHGIDVLLSALHTKQSCGIGEFLDLLPLIDWCAELKLDVIQLLPLNDSDHDPSPYNALSSCALNPIYLSLHALPYLEEHPELRKKFDPLRELTKLQKVDYHKVQSHKLGWLRSYFEGVGQQILHSKEFQRFVGENPWIEAYALFRAIKESLEQNSWETWPEEMRSPSREEYVLLLEQHAKGISFYSFLQYLCFSQLEKVKAYATAHKVFLKGDIPMLIGRESVDVWHHPEIFDLTLAAGAPPDFYNKEGQYWGLPLFNWSAMRKEKFSWWKQRLANASRLYDIYRIDHVVGFFRIWGIPLGRPAKEGQFHPSEESLWVPQGKEILEMMLEASPMLPIAEDLGVVPPETRICLTELGICGTKVICWERRWKEDGRYIPYEEYPSLSMTCVSTHDSPTLELWWRDYPEDAIAFCAFKEWKYAPQLTQAQRKEILYDSHHTPSLFHINLLQEYLALFYELVWPNPEEERINIPGTVLPTNWTYRYRPSVEELTSHEGLKSAFWGLI